MIRYVIVMVRDYFFFIKPLVKALALMLFVFLYQSEQEGAGEGKN